MMDQLDRDFAGELIKKYGEDRFYHSCKRTRDSYSALRLHMELNSCGREESERFLRSIGIDRMSHRVGAGKETPREILCRIACGFVRYFKEFGLRTHKLPSVLHARMLLGETNEWVRSYAKLLETFPDWEPAPSRSENF